MKQGTIKTLGVAALGAAFAATAAGSASAASPVETATGAVSGIAQGLPAGAPEAVAAGQSALTNGLSALPLGVDKLLSGEGEGNAAKPPAGNMLGGLPTGVISGALPIGG